MDSQSDDWRRSFVISEKVVDQDDYRRRVFAFFDDRNGKDLFNSLCSRVRVSLVLRDDNIH